MPKRHICRLLLLGLGVLALASGCAPGTERSAGVDAGAVERPDAMAKPGYRLREGDLVEIRFHADPTNGFATPIAPGGTISIPMGGEVMAAGLTTEELSLAVSESVSEYLVDPTASVLLLEVAPQPVFVIGEVGNPGRVDYTGRLTLSMALAQAGGMKATGKPSSVMIVRTYGVDEPVAIKADVTKVLSGRDLSEDVELTGNDVVYVPKSVIGKVGEFVELFFTNIAPAQLFYLRGYDMANLEGVQWRF